MEKKLNQVLIYSILIIQFFSFKQLLKFITENDQEIFIPLNSVCKMTPIPGKTSHPKEGKAYKLGDIRGASLPLKVRCVFGSTPLHTEKLDAHYQYILTGKAVIEYFTCFLFSRNDIYIMDIPSLINIPFEVPLNNNYKTTQQFRNVRSFVRGISHVYSKRTRPYQLSFKISKFPFSKTINYSKAVHIAQVRKIK